MRSMALRLITLCLVAPFVAFAASSSPVPMLQGASDQMISQLKQNQGRLKDKKVIHQIVNNVLVPHIDLSRMAGSVVGRNYWMAATPAQRQQFIEEFKNLVINTYANALASFNDDQVQFYPMRGAVSSSTAQVRSVIIRKNGQRIGISYNVVKTDGAWKVYDFSIEGVSIVNNYSAQFSSTLAQGGMPMLINRLYNFNRGKK